MPFEGVVAPVFRSLARIRRARVFHPRGVAYEATWVPGAGGTLDPDHDLLRAPRPAVVRFSRGAGLPTPAPDILGIAVKVFDAYGPGHDQDLLLASVWGSRFARWMLAPRTSFEGTGFSTVFAYDANGTRTAVVGVVRGEPATSYAGHIPHEDVEVELAWPDGEELARVPVGEPLAAAASDALRFDPWHTGDSLRPAGVLNAIRRPAYQASQAGRAAPPDGVRWSS